MVPAKLQKYALLLLFLLPLSLMGQIPYCEEGSYIKVSGGCRQDLLKWMISGPDGVPNILSELKWKPLKITEAKLEGKWIFCDEFYVRGSAAYGRIYDGHNRDRDWDGNNRTLPVADSKAKSDKGEVFDFSGGLGYRFFLCDDAVTIAPIAGYSHSEQHLRDRKGFLLFDTGFNEGEELIGVTGPFPGLHSNYRAKWTGPWVGFDWTYQVLYDWDFFGSFEYHWARFHGTGHWNLRTDFIKDFQQRARNAHGCLVTVGANYYFCGGWFIGAEADFYYFKGKHGKDRVYTVDGTFEMPFKKVVWESWAVLGSLGYQF